MITLTNVDRFIRSALGIIMSSVRPSLRL